MLCELQGWVNQIENVPNFPTNSKQNIITASCFCSANQFFNILLFVLFWIFFQSFFWFIMWIVKSVWGRLKQEENTGKRNQTECAIYGQLHCRSFYYIIIGKNWAMLFMLHLMQWSQSSVIYLILVDPIKTNWKINYSKSVIMWKYKDVLRWFFDSSKNKNQNVIKYEEKQIYENIWLYMSYINSNKSEWKEKNSSMTRDWRPI